MELRKTESNTSGGASPNDFANPFELMCREEATRRDKIDLHHINWSLATMYQRELSSRGLTKQERYRLMNTLRNKMVARAAF